MGIKLASQTSVVNPDIILPRIKIRAYRTPNPVHGDICFMAIYSSRIYYCFHTTHNETHFYHLIILSLIVCSKTRFMNNPNRLLSDDSVIRQYLLVKHINWKVDTLVINKNNWKAYHCQLFE